MSVTARLVVNGSEKMEHRFNKLAELNERLSGSIPEVMVPLGYKISREVTPRLTGFLQDSFTDRVDGNQVTFSWEAKYANWVNDGVPPSPGRYVPKLGKRLTDTSLSPRTQVYRQAKKQGFSEYAARAAYRTRITYTSKAQELAAEHMASLGEGKSVVGTHGLHFSRVAGQKDITFEDWARGKNPTIPMDDLRKGHVKNRRTGSINIISHGERDKAETANTTRHELWHAVQWAAGESFTPGRTAGLELRAREGAMASGLQKADIGMHPGQKGQHYMERFNKKMIFESRRAFNDLIRRLLQ